MGQGRDCERESKHGQGAAGERKKKAVSPPARGRVGAHAKPRAAHARIEQGSRHPKLRVRRRAGRLPVPAAAKGRPRCLHTAASARRRQPSAGPPGSTPTQPHPPQKQKTHVTQGVGRHLGGQAAVEEDAAVVKRGGGERQRAATAVCSGGRRSSRRSREHTKRQTHSFCSSSISSFFWHPVAGYAMLSCARWEG